MKMSTRDVEPSIGLRRDEMSGSERRREPAMIISNEVRALTSAKIHR